MSQTRRKCPVGLIMNGRSGADGVKPYRRLKSPAGRRVALASCPHLSRKLVEKRRSPRAGCGFVAMEMKNLVVKRIALLYDKHNLSPETLAHVTAVAAQGSAPSRARARWLR
ncbi:hypothetical protein SPRG_18227 [Saprolegnia parasitica CBS 223.65]|uniref:Uncharacterized protein n=1 Tax=Saprolegnia parasitica (strain CBS 223.65) TaxID=695850 RepID=A0A067BHP7_SAPPC|nr:hypothetical protein SPRG_18227 [Saprolegnia parasitica CBS 223.65]KDO16240.1 hypothetical protein SPRG_18227 [Saprolegnia parasitica CBS 223.65]|eukprot:XP_012213054.1 hypothetical protein SPRG_18227 [Saprolegnia parasitica CBS 223.65]